MVIVNYQFLTVFQSPHLNPGSEGCYSSSQIYPIQRKINGEALGETMVKVICFCKICVSEVS